MLLELQEPFKSQWQKGYVYTRSEDGRQVVRLHNDNGERLGMTYARYLKSVELGYVVPPEFEVDHRNDDRTDDRPENLQLLTPLENKAKEWVRKSEEIPSYGYYCGTCGNPFLVDASDHAKRQTQGNEKHYCSRQCFYLSESASPPPAKGKTEEEIAQIKELRANGKTSYQIAEITGMSRNTVMKYW